MAVVQNKRRTTAGGVTGSGFRPGVSGNPGGRPKGLTRRVRELVGDDGAAIAEYMVAVMGDGSQRTADRMEAAKWLADRGFGRSPQFDEAASRGWPDEHQLDRLTLEELTTLRDLIRKAVSVSA